MSASGRRLRQVIRGGGALLVCGVVAGQLKAQSLATVVTAPGGTFHAWQLVGGWEFTVTSEVEVTALGQWDHRLDGLLNPAAVGIYDEVTEALLVSAEVAAGSGPMLENQFRMVELASPVSLQPGQSYVIGSNVNDQVIRTDGFGGPDEFSTSPDVNLVRWRFLTGTALEFPSGGTIGADGLGHAFFGPTFKYRTVAPRSRTLYFSGPLKFKEDSNGALTYSRVEEGELMRGRFTIPLTDQDGTFIPPAIHGFPSNRYSGALTGGGITTGTAGSTRPLEVSFFDDFLLDEEGLELVNSCLGLNLPLGTRVDLAEIEVDRTAGNRRLEFGVSLISLDLNFFSGSEYRPFPALDEVDGAIYFVVEEVDDEEGYYAVGAVTEFGRDEPDIVITDITRVGQTVRIQFEAAPGVTGWKVRTSPDLTFRFLDLLPAATTESPPGSGHYTAEVNVGTLGPTYFLRVED